MIGYLLDTNVISEIMRTAPHPGVVAFLSEREDLWLSSIVIHELEYGVRRMPQGRRRDGLEAELSRLFREYQHSILPLERNGAEWAAEFRVQAQSSGRTLELGDALIAGIARANDLAVATRNITDFDGLDVEVVNPLGPPMTTITEADVEEAALAWLADLGWVVAHGPEIAPDTPNAERDEYGQVVLERRLRDSLAELNPSLPVDALDDAYRKLTRPEGSTLEVRNREFHRMLVNGVEIEYREAGGRVRGELVRVIDFDVPANNDLLAVNQFTVNENKNTRRPDVVLFVNGLPWA